MCSSVLVAWMASDALDARYGDADWHSAMGLVPSSCLGMRPGCETATGGDRYACAVAGAVAAVVLAWRRSRPIASGLAVLGALAVVSLLGHMDGVWPIAGSWCPCTP